MVEDYTFEEYQKEKLCSVKIVSTKGESKKERATSNHVCKHKSFKESSRDLKCKLKNTVLERTCACMDGRAFEILFFIARNISHKLIFCS